jgi:hypothetical protein
MDDEGCPVCCDKIESTDATTLACGHGFHHSCLQTWLERNPSCPMCRQDASEDLELECRVCNKKFEARRYKNAQSARRACRNHMSDRHRQESVDRVWIFEDPRFDHLEGFDRIFAEFTAQRSETPNRSASSAYDQHW